MLSLMNSAAQQITIHTGAETGMTGDLTIDRTAKS